MINGIKIMNLEGSEILKNNLDGVVINKDYKAVIDNSLLLDKLMELGLKVSNDTTRDIISVNFSYGYTPASVEDIVNKIKENNNKISNKIKEKKDKIEERKLQSNNKDKKPYTKNINELAEDIRNLKKDSKDLEAEIKELKMDGKEIRNKLYAEGFYLDFYKKDRVTKEYKLDQKINYKFWFRSPSKSRTGEVCFINEKLLNNIRAWQTMGLQLPHTNAKLVEMEAYLSLTSSSMIGKLIINPKTEILVVNDLESYTDVMCARVNYHVADDLANKNDKEDMCYVTEGKSRVKNVLWDGMALLDDSLFTGDKSFYLLRQHFFKACGFRTFVSKFFKDWCEENGKDYNTYTVKDRYNRDIFVKDIKMITTENAMKWEKFTDIGATYDYWCNKVEEDNNVFAIVKEDHKSKYGKYQRHSYQHINSLPITKEESIKLCKDSIEYVNNLKNNNELYIEFLERTKSDVNANEMIIDLYKHNNNFAKSDFFRKYKTKNISEYKETLRAGKLLTEGDNLTVCGNPYLLLLHSIGEIPYKKDFTIAENYVDPTLPILDKGYSVYTTRFIDKAEIAMFRNPHNAPNNILYGINYKNELMEEYFNFNDNVIAINMIRTDAQARANGMDEDSDFCLCTINNTAVSAAKEALKYPTIVNDIPEEKRKYDNTMEALAFIDNTLAEGKYSIGLSSNLAQLALSWWWKSNGTNKELKNIVAICSVLAQVSIDNSKRKYNIDLNKEVARISKIECMDVRNGELKAKPYFWQFVKEIKEKEVKKFKNIDKFIQAKIKAKIKKNEKIEDLLKHCIDEKICPMDWIQSGVDTIENAYTNDKCIDDHCFIQDIEGKSNDRQRKKIEDIVKKLDNFYKAHFDNVAEGIEEDDEAWEVEQLIKTKDTLDKIKKFSIQPKTMQMLIVDAFNSNKKYKRKLLNCLYKSHKKLFLEGFKK